METFSDPALDKAVEAWEASGFNNDECFYAGTIEDVAGKLSGYVERIKWIGNRQMNLREQRNMANERDFENESKGAAGRDVELSKKFTKGRGIRQGILDKLDEQSNQEKTRASYLIGSLKKRGIKWTVARDRAAMIPEADVCAFLASVDEEFDAKATYEELYAKEREETIQSKAHQNQQNWLEAMKTSAHLRQVYLSRWYPQEATSGQAAMGETGLEKMKQAAREKYGDKIKWMEGSWEATKFYG
ncbi:MAG: hypothetical protein Q9170_003784 [Blastenia crenularia]